MLVTLGKIVYASLYFDRKRLLINMCYWNKTKVYYLCIQNGAHRKREVILCHEIL